MREYLFVGVDPGTTAGVAALNLDGDVVDIYSSRELGISEIIEYVIDIGNPVVVATDVSPPPSTASKLATMLDAKLWHPEEPLSQEEKREEVKDFDCSNKHEEDALAAALRAYNSMRNKLRKVESQTPPDANVLEIKKKVIEDMSVSNAINTFQKNSDSSDKKQKRNQSIDNRIKGLEEKISDLYDRIEEFKDGRARREKEIKELKSELSRVKSKKFLEALQSKEVKARDKKISSLKKELEQEKKRSENLKTKLKDINKVEKIKGEENIILKNLKSFTKEDIDELEKNIGIEKEDIIYIEDPSGGGKSNAERLSEKVRAVALEGKLSYPAKEKFIDERIPFFNVEDLNVKKEGSFVVADQKKIESRLHEKIEKLQIQKEKEIESMLKEHGLDVKIRNKED